MEWIWIQLYGVDWNGSWKYVPWRPLVSSKHRQRVCQESTHLFFTSKLKSYDVAPTSTTPPSRPDIASRVLIKFQIPPCAQCHLPSLHSTLSRASPMTASRCQTRRGLSVASGGGHVDQGQGGVRWTARGASQSVERGVKGGLWGVVVSDIIGKIRLRVMGYRQIIF